MIFDMNNFIGAIIYSSNFSIKVQIWVQINLSHVIRTLKICSHKIEQKSEIDEPAFWWRCLLYIFLKKQLKTTTWTNDPLMGGFDMGINVIKETTSVVIHNRKSFSFGVKFLKKKCTIYVEYDAEKITLLHYRIG